MNFPAATLDRRQAFAGVAVGIYAALVALLPGPAAKGTLCAPLVAIPLLWWILGRPNRWLTLFLLSALLLPPLPMAIGNSGPHIALLFAAAGLFIGVLRIPEWRVQLDGLGAALLALFAVFLGSVAVAAIHSGIAIAAGSLARVALLGIAVYVFLYVRDGPGRISASRPFGVVRILFWAAAGSALFACVDFYFQFPAPAGYGPQFIWLDTGVFRRAQGVFYEASTLGNLCAFFLEMIAVALFQPRSNRPLSRFAMLAGGAALAPALVLSFSRASLLNVAVALIVLLWFYRQRIRLRRLFAGVGLLGAAVAAILAGIFPVFTEMYWLRISLSLQYMFESPNAVLSGRLRSWELLRDFLLAHPWHALLGVGYKTLPYSDFIGTTAVADNTYLSSLVETGVLGFAAVIALNIAILATAYRAARAQDPERAFCGIWMFCFWAGQAVQMFSADLLTYWRVLPIYLCVLALAVRERSDEHPISGPVQ